MKLLKYLHRIVHPKLKVEKYEIKCATHATGTQYGWKKKKNK